MILKGEKIVVTALLYLLALGIAEVVTVYHPVLGLAIHASILLFLIILSSYVKEEKFSKLLLALAIPPLIRILSISVPIIIFLNPIYHFLLIYIPLLLTALLLIRHHKMKAKDVGITDRKLKLQMIIGLSGLLFGIIEYLILGVIENYIPITETINFGELLSHAFILLFFTGVTEELIFRGIILTNITKFFSANKSIIFVSVLFMLMHAQWRSVLDLLFVFAVSLFYCYVFLKTKSVVGVSLSHGITNVVEFVVIPIPAVLGFLTEISGYFSF